MTEPSESKHTPGPWLWDHGGEQIHSSHGQVIVYELGSNEANARLIAAAPTLLDALTWARRELLGCGGHIDEKSITVIDAAIAAATNEGAA